MREFFLKVWKHSPKVAKHVENKGGTGNFEVKIDGRSSLPPTVFQEMKPLAWVMFMNQLWPVQTCDDGRRVEAPVWSIASATTLLMYGALLPLHMMALVQPLNHCCDEQKSFASFVYRLSYPAIAHHHMLTPLIAWLPAARLADYFNAWTDFQNQWYRRLDRPLYFHRLKKRSRRTAIRGVLSPLLVTTACFALAQSLRLSQFPTFMMSSAFLFLRSASWCDLCAVHEEAANQLGDILCDTLKKNDQTETLRSLRATWLSLRGLSGKLASGAGAIPPLHYTCCLLAISLLASVGVLMAALRNTATAVTGAQFLVALNNLFHIAKMHQAGYKASLAVRGAVLQPLLSSQLLDDVIRDDEVLSFISTIDRNSAVITIGDFTNCSRSALVQFFSTFVTYIVVLVQFAYSISSEGDAVRHG